MLFELVSRRYLHKSTVVTTNRKCGAPHFAESLLPGGCGALTVSNDATPTAAFGRQKIPLH
jgi:hypothetical protein